MIKIVSESEHSIIFVIIHIVLVPRYLKLDF
jgi:hypothetical protein